MALLLQEERGDREHGVVKGAYDEMAEIVQLYIRTNCRNRRSNMLIGGYSIKTGAVRNASSELVPSVFNVF